MLEYRRYRGAAEHLAELFAEGRATCYRAAPLPPELRRVALEAARPAYDPDRLGAAIGDLLRVPPRPDTQPHPPDGLARRAAAGPARPARPPADDRLRRGVRRRGQADPGGDALRAARDAQARRGDLGAGRHVRRDHDRGGAMTATLEQTVEALLFLSAEPVSAAELAEACDASEAEIDRALDLLGAIAAGPRRRAARGRRRLRARLAPRGRGRRAAAARQAEDAAAHPGAGRDARDRRLPAAGLATGDRADPRGLVGVGGRRRSPSAV